MKKYYILEWNDYCWDSFLQYQIDILECYKMKNKFIRIDEYRDNPNDNYYISDRYYTRKDFCFESKKENIFVNFNEAKREALKKLDIMYLSRCEFLIKERDEAIKKINKIIPTF